jgi:diguanylate cyclase (GGDEF)-like protein
VIEAIAASYQVDCLLWLGFESATGETVQVYGTAGALQRHAGSPDLDEQSEAIQKVHLSTLPAWFLDQQASPQISQLENGALILPIESGGRLQFVLQLVPISATQEIPTWNPERLADLEVVRTQLLLAYQVLYWRQRLDQFRQQAAIGGRIAHLLNSNLNPDEIVKHILSELGQGLQSDRSILLDLRDDSVSVLASWDNPELDLPVLESTAMNRRLWQGVVEMFLQWAASYVDLDILAGEADPLADWLQAVGVVSATIVPLFIRAEFFGAILLVSYHQPQVFSLDELQVIRQLADQTAIALTNAQHYQNLWYQQESQRLQSNSPPREILQDHLTQLLNQRALERELEQLSTPARWAIGSPFSIVVCDLDYFQLVNDTYGHQVGDQVLQSLAQRLQQQLRQGTFVYRYGGEEFGVILADVPVAKALDVTERLRSVIRTTPFETMMGQLNITASFGVAQQDPTQDQTAWDVMQRAEQALYQAKRQGRDCVVAL